MSADLVAGREEFRHLFARDETLPVLAHSALSMNAPPAPPPRIGIPPDPFDPWEEISRLGFGEDRTQAWTIRQTILHTPPAGRPALEQKLLGALTKSAPDSAGRAYLCEMLGLIGTAASVPALGALLREPASAELARQALERIPGAEADLALRDALGTMSGPALAGLIGTVALRGDTQALPLLRRLRDDKAQPAVVRETTEHALQHLERHAR